MAGFVNFVGFQMLILTIWISSSMGALKTISFTQSLDHCSAIPHKATFQQRLSVNDDHWGGPKSGNPIFVMLGDLTQYTLVTVNPNKYGILALSAIEFKAMLVNIEHRFYGQSVPLGSIDLAMENDQIRSHLSVDEVLEDIVAIIQSLKRNYSAHNSPVIVVGIGYGGVLATWFRMKYPEIAIGALASSAPILYFGNTRPGRRYCSIVSNDYKEFDPKCYEMIRQSWKDIDDIASQPNGLANLRKIFKTCSPLQSADKLKELFAQNFCSVALDDDPDHYLKKLVCNLMTASKNPIEGLVSIQLETLSNGTCNVNEYTEVNSPFEPASNVTTAWAWLQCTGLIYTVGCENDTMLPSRAFNMSQFKELCIERFHVDPSPYLPISFSGDFTTVESITKFGGNIIFSNGLKDPLSRGGILKNLSKTVNAIIATKGTYAWDMRTIEPNYEPEWLIAGRQEELKIFNQWINKGSSSCICKLSMYLLQCISILYMYLNH